MENRQLPPCPTGRFWKIRPGDTYFIIASHINTTVDAIKKLNPGVDPRRLHVGQIICIPDMPPCLSGVYWEVAAGDTLYAIARAVGTTVQRLIELNPGIDPNKLRINQKICLPG
ncbi:MAG: LysM peptidoglycan-binding domain-containing protein [Syntrophomonadaceae bacterium]|nr:LysM peptidoglycan-binding domain-containing protein [Syntrophomonadaceae bacterium]